MPSDGKTLSFARARSVAKPEDIGAAIDALAIERSRPVLVLIGGADGLDEETTSRLRPLFREEVLPTLAGLHATIVDGGTDSGIMRVAGEASAAARATCPLVGVVPEAKVRAVGAHGSTDRLPTLLEPNHSAFLLVPGREWGDESTWLFDTAAAIAREQPRVTVLIDGGDVAADEAALSVSLGQRVLVVAGTGRTAARLERAMRDGTADEDLAPVVATGAVEIVEPERLAEALGKHLKPRAPEPSGHKPPRVSLEELLESLDLTAVQKRMLRGRWLDQITWFTSRAKTARRRYQMLHFTTVIGGVAVPPLVSYSLGVPNVPDWIRLVTFTTSLVVAITAAFEEAMHYGDTWRQYRSTAEALKSEGWEYLFLTGSYDRFPTHAAGYRTFTGRVESVLRQDVSGYFQRVMDARPAAQRPDVVV